MFQITPLPHNFLNEQKQQIPRPLFHMRIISLERPPRPAKLMPTFAGREYCVVRAADAYGR
jgi:hypothetical protein